MTVFWVVAPCSLAIIALMMKAARTSETLVNFYHTAWRYNPQDNHLPEDDCLLGYCAVQSDRRFRISYCSQSISLYRTTQHNKPDTIPEDKSSSYLPIPANGQISIQMGNATCWQR
jgi:hypothetical protein